MLERKLPQSMLASYMYHHWVMTTTRLKNEQAENQRLSHECRCHSLYTTQGLSAGTASCESPSIGQDLLTIIKHVRIPVLFGDKTYGNK